MGINGISVWGVVLVIILFVASLGVFWFSDRKMFVRSLRALSSMSIQMILAAVYIWGVFRLDNWLVNILWLTIMSGIVAYIYTRRVRLPLQRFWPVLAVSVFCGSLLTGGCLLLCVQTSHARQLFVPVMAIFIGSLLTSGTLALSEYLICLRNTRSHRRYLQANGATHLESVIPCVRRSMRASLLPLFKFMSSPLIVAWPLLLCGMLMGGMPLGIAIVVTILVMMTTYAVTVLTDVMILWLSDRYLFDSNDNFNPSGLVTTGNA